MLKIKQARLKVGLAEQGSSLGNKAKKEGVCQWKQGQMTWEEYRGSACNFGEKICAAKAQLELKLGGNMGDHKKSFFKYINGNRQYRNIIGPLQGEDGHLTNRQKAEMFDTFFASVFNMNDGPRGSQWPELEYHDYKSDPVSADPEFVWDLLLQLDPSKSMDPDGIHLRILKELADVTTKPLSMIFEQSWECRGVQLIRSQQIMF
ncbi:rna-directed dna polymerase from mobile element jockey-like [Pitangus sulphuratus]|nr:rna-directed dna polymerase from mobile element jockey-like [Pitangus sulphuratus]